MRVEDPDLVFAMLERGASIQVLMELEHLDLTDRQLAVFRRYQSALDACIAMNRTSLAL